MVRRMYNGNGMENQPQFMQTCIFPKCNKPIKAKGFCKPHYHRFVFLKNHPLYNTWRNMIRRCENPRNPNFAEYGGKGVRVCPRWRKSYYAFAKDVGLRPSVRHSLDRINVKGDYAPGNTQWATPTQQAFNRRQKSTNKSGVTGVYYHKKFGKWHATITINKRRRHLGWFTSKKTAIEARALAESRIGYNPVNAELENR